MNYDLYGHKKTILEAKKLLEESLSVEMEDRESDFLDNYFRYFFGEEEMKLQMNFNSIEEGYDESDFLAYPVLLYVDCTGRSDFFQEKLPTLGFELLRLENIPEM